MAAGPVTGIREYLRQGTDADGKVVPAGEEPALVATAITVTGSSAQHTFNVATRFFLLKAGPSAINHAVVPGNNPTAIVDGAGRLGPEETQFLGLAVGGKNDAGVVQAQKIALILDP